MLYTILQGFQNLVGLLLKSNTYKVKKKTLQENRLSTKTIFETYDGIDWNK
ncbi:hypothetical protein CLU83_0406 [Flavobacterium sp. 1]|uniref:hypothetical protein n=1 Tax=Flavobacterium sp. 1 TaxID=2035200 RepID=UPI000CB11A84|nr:hypothetical protein [Flavobacterium sp. 1]PJJ07250.1 hypothetical protein CLU83_0406 [Flavobacterium sp. 1]